MTKLVAIYRVNPVIKAGVATGNFSAYDESGTRENRMHVPKSLAESFGLKADTAMPIYAIVSEETYNKVDDSGNPIKDENGEVETFTQKRAGNLFKDEESAIKAHKSSAVLEAKANAYVNEVAKSLNLTAEALVSLSNVI